MDKEEQPFGNPDSAFVGRVRERSELVAGLNACLSGRGRLFLISGEPGIGKTRLIDEFCHNAASRGIRALWGRCWHGLGAPPYWPWVQIFRQVIASRDADEIRAICGDEGDPRSLVELAQIIPELRALFRRIAQLPRVLDQDQSRFKLFDSAARFIGRLASLEPLLIVLDDAHDADLSSLVMLTFIARQLRTQRVLIVVTYREFEMSQSVESNRQLGDLSREAIHLPLNGLSESEVEQFLAAREQSDPSLAPRVRQLTAGNPFFIESLLRSRRTKDASVSLAQVPDSVQESIRRRLGRLTARTAAMLAVAAVIGHEFDVGVLAELTNAAPPEVRDGMREAVSAGLLVRQTENKWSFCHALIHMAVQETLPSAELAQLHHRVAEVLERRGGPETLAVLARHFRQAADLDDARKALDYSIRAGEAAREVFAYEEAFSHWSAALEFLEIYAPDSEQRGDLLHRLGQMAALTQTDQWVAVRYLERALKAFSEGGNRLRAAEAHLELGTKLEWPPLFESARAESHYERARVLLAEAKPSRALANLYIALQDAQANRQNTAKAVSLGEKALEIARQLDEESWIAAAKRHSQILWMAGRLSEAFALMDSADARRDQHNDPALLTGPFWGGCLFNLWDVGTAKRWYEDQLSKPTAANAFGRREELLRRAAYAYALGGQLQKVAQIRSQITIHTHFEAISSLYLSPWNSVKAELEACLSSYRSPGSSIWSSATRLHLARLHRARGEPRRAIESLLASPILLRPRGHFPFEIAGRAELALAHLEAGNVFDAGEQTRLCRELIDNGEDWCGLKSTLLRTEAALAGAEKRVAEADALFAEANAVQLRYNVVLEQAETLVLWGRALAANRQPVRAGEKFDTAEEIYGRCGAAPEWTERVRGERDATAAPHAPLNVCTHPTDLSAEMRREGEYWALQWRGKTSRIRHVRGLEYIAHLLLTPGQEIHALQLTGLGENAETGRKSVDRESKIGLAGDAGEMLDRQAMTAYRNRILDLREELEAARRDGEEERAEDIEGEIEALTRELSRAVGLGGRTRRAGSQAERARIGVTKAIRLALKKIDAVDANLAAELTASIKTGYFCCYEPYRPNRD